jgi:hypothetical protein
MSMQYDPTAYEKIMTFRGVTNNSTTSGSCALSSPLNYRQTDTYFLIPLGMKMKIKGRWGVATTQATQFTIDVSHDAGSTWVELDRLYVAATAEENTLLNIHSSPIIIPSPQGTERMRIGWSGQGSAGLAYCTVVFSLENMSEDD